MPFAESIFGPIKDSVWKELCDKIGGEFVRGGSWHGNSVVARVKDWTVTLDTTAVADPSGSMVYTRMHAPFENPSKFTFTVYRKGPFSGIAKLFGMQDIVVGHEPFDTDFIVQGNDPDKVKALFADTTVRALLSAQSVVHFAISDYDGKPGGIDELLFQVPGLLDNVEQLQKLFELFSAVIDRLCAIGAAAPKLPRAARS